MGIKERTLQEKLRDLAGHLQTTIRANSEMTEKHNQLLQILAGILTKFHAGTIKMATADFPDLNSFKVHVEKKEDSVLIRADLLPAVLAEAESGRILCEKCGKELIVSGSAPPSHLDIPEDGHAAVLPIPETEQRFTGKAAEFDLCPIHRKYRPKGSACGDCLEEHFGRVKGDCCDHPKNRHVGGVGKCKMNDCECDEFRFLPVEVKKDEADVKGPGAAGDGKDPVPVGTTGAGAEGDPGQPGRVLNLHQGGKSRGPRKNGKKRG